MAPGIEKRPPNPMTWVYAAFGVAFALALAHKIVIAPRMTTLEERKIEVEALAGRVAEIEAEVAAQQSAGASASDAAAEEDEAVRATNLSGSKAQILGTIIDRLARSQAAGLFEVRSFQAEPSDVSADGLVEETPFRLAVAGRYASIVALLTELESGYPIAHVRAVSVSPAPEKGAILRAEVTGSLFVVGGGEKSAAGGNTPRVAQALATLDPFASSGRAALAAASGASARTARGAFALSAAARAPAPHAPPFRGVLVRAGVRTAMFGMRFVAVGATVEGWTILEIGAKSCLVEKEGVRKTLVPGTTF